MEFVEGENFVDAFRERPHEEFDGLAAECLRALSFLHDFGFIHRDIKPANLMIRKNPVVGHRVVYLDFGLALERTDPSDQVGAGTVPYMAPELFEGKAPSRESDIYSLGVVFYQALHGRLPFAWIDGNLTRYLEESRAGLQGCPSDSSPLAARMHGLIESMLHPDVTRRQSRCDQLIARLGEATNRLIPNETPATRRARIESGSPIAVDSAIECLGELINAETGPNVVLLAGDVASGKSRLLDWARAEAVSRGLHVVDIRDEDDLILGDSSDHRLAIIDTLETAPKAVQDWFCERARLGGDDSLAIAAAVREQEAIHPGLQTILRDDRGSSRIRCHRLGPFDRGGCVALARRAEPDVLVSEERAAWLLEQSGGQPAILGLLVSEQRWENHQPGEALPELTATFVARIDELAIDARAAVERLAVVPGSVRLGEWAALTGMEDVLLRQVTNELTRSGLVSLDGDRVRVASRWVQTAILSAIDPAQIRPMHRETAEWIEQSGRGDLGGLSLATVWRKAGRPDRAREIAIAVADNARHSNDRRLAVQATEELLRNTDPRSVEWGAARLELGAVRFADEDYLPALRSYTAGLRGCDDIRERLSIELRRAEILARLQKSDHAARLAEKAIRVGTAFDWELETAHGQIVSGMAMVSGGDLRPAEPLLESAYAACSRVGDDEGATISAHLLATCLKINGPLSDAIRWCEVGLELAENCSDHRQVVNSLITLADFNNHATGKLKRRAYLAKARDLAEGQRLMSRFAWVLDRECVDMTLDEDYENALLSVQELLRIQARLGMVLDQAEGRALEILNLLGRHTEVIPRSERELKEAQRTGDRLGESAQLDHWLNAAVPLERSVTERIRRAARPTEYDADFSPRNQRHLESSQLKLSIYTSCPDLDDVYERFCNGVDEGAKLGFVRTEFARICLLRCEYFKHKQSLNEALEQADTALQEANNEELHGIAASAQVLRCEILTELDRDAEAEEARVAGKKSLQIVADRIKDDDLRADFLGQPAYRVLHEERTQEAGEERLLAVYEMIRQLNSEQEPEWMLESTLDMALSVVNADRGMILLRDEATGEYRVRLARNLEKETIEDAARFSRNVVLQTATGKAVLAMDTGSDERLRDLRSVSLYGIRSVLCVPLRTRGTIIGAVYLDSQVAGVVFVPEDLQFLEAFADHAALALQNAHSRRRLERENQRLRSAIGERDGFCDLVGRSAPMQRTYSWIERVAETSLPVLVQGESGTGKELVAHAIHQTSLRSRRAFVSENCASIAESLLESELFGHVKGAFTGADRDRDGLFAQADGGTLFLDEIGDMPLSMQARLLRVLQEGEVRPVGGNQTLSVDVRVIAATHRNLTTEVAEGRFREDLLYRLLVLPIDLAPLRDRLGDVPLLVDHFLTRAARERQENPLRIETAAMDYLERCQWPGNVRELQSVIQRLVLVASPGPITQQHVAQDPFLAGHEKDDAKRVSGPQESPGPLSLHDNERQQIDAALAACDGNKTLAARRLGISRATIFRKIKKFGLEG